MYVTWARLLQTVPERSHVRIGSAAVRAPTTQSGFKTLRPGCVCVRRVGRGVTQRYPNGNGFLMHRVLHGDIVTSVTKPRTEIQHDRANRVDAIDRQIKATAQSLHALQHHLKQVWFGADAQNVVAKSDVENNAVLAPDV